MLECVAVGLVDNHPHVWPVALQPLEHRAFRWLWIGTLVSNAGSWMQRVATAWLVFSLSGSAAWLGLDAFAAGIPTVVLLPLGGVLADRIDRRKLLMGTNLVSAVLAALLGVGWWLQVLQAWHIVACSFVAGVMAAVSVPASQSVLPAVVGEDHLPGAVALNSVQYNVARAVGPAVGGVALAWGGPTWCFGLNAASFLVLVGVFAVLREIPRVERRRQSVAAGMREGMVFLKARGDLRRVLFCVGLLALGGAPVVTMLPALTKEVLGLEASAFSVLLTAFGIGAAGAGVVLTLWPTQKRAMVVITAAMLVVGVADGVLVMGEPLWLAAVVVGAAGAAFVGAMIELGTVLLLRTPDAFRGRVSSFQQMVFRAGQPVGGLAAGLMAAHLTTRVAFLIFAGVLTVGTLVQGVLGGGGEAG